MRGIVTALSALGALCLAAPATAQVLAQQPASIVSALQAAGYKAQLTKDDVGDPLIESSSGGTDFRVYFYNCTDNADCRTIQFYAGYSEPSDASAEAMNTWNKQNRFGRAYVDGEGVARIEMDVDLDDGGVSQALFEDNLEFWVSVMSKFESYIGY